MNDGGPKVLVTGASGFVGRHVVPVLARNGWSARRAVRTPPQDANDVTIDLLSPTTDWRAALDGVDAGVIWPRAYPPPGRTSRRSSSTTTSISGARCIWRAPRLRPAFRDFIFVSTILVHGRSN